MVTPGSAGAAGSTGALFVVRRGEGDAGPALEWVVPGNRLSLPRKEWQSLKAGQETVPFSPKPAAAIQSVQVWFTRGRGWGRRLGFC